jgi:hypothetical protein
MNKIEYNKDTIDNILQCNKNNINNSFNNYNCFNMNHLPNKYNNINNFPKTNNRDATKTEYFTYNRNDISNRNNQN